MEFKLGQFYEPRNGHCGCFEDGCGQYRELINITNISETGKTIHFTFCRGNKHYDQWHYKSLIRYDLERGSYFDFKLYKLPIYAVDLIEPYIGPIPKPIEYSS